MTPGHKPVTPPALADLFRQFLARQSAAHAEGLGYAEPGDGAVPHDAVPVQPVDPQLAWNDAVAAARHFQPDARGWAVAPDWPGLVAAQEPTVALAFCLGNFPQLVRNLHPFLSAEPAALRVATSGPVSAPGLDEWAAKSRAYPQVLLAAGVLRLARHHDRAAELLAADTPAAWQAARANEQAALAWHRGEAERALALWAGQPESVPVRFNRGMAALFLGRPAEARDALARAVAALPETDAWHHLACLYLALAEARV